MGPFVWDEGKRETNLIKHGIDFLLINDFGWEEAFTRTDKRVNYGEERFVSFGRIDGRLFVVVWVRRGNLSRLISLRKANAREEKLYDRA